jgi:hypothetical protein
LRICVRSKTKRAWTTILANLLINNTTCSKIFSYRELSSCTILSSLIRMHHCLTSRWARTSCLTRLISTLITSSAIVFTCWCLNEAFWTGKFLLIS